MFSIILYLFSKNSDVCLYKKDAISAEHADFVATT